MSTHAVVVHMEPVAYDYEGAALATGLSEKTIRRAVHAGDLPVHYPSINGRDISKPVVLRDDLHSWVARGGLVRELT